MLHLFNKVYVYPDFMIEDSLRRILISKNPQAQEINASYNSVATHAADIAELFSTSASCNDWPSFFSHLMREGNVIIYADVEATAQICVALLKTLFPSITPVMARRVYNTYVQRITLHFPGDIVTKSFAERRRQVWMAKTRLTNDEFTELFNRVAPWQDDLQRSEWVFNHVSEFSIEFHLATYFNNPSHLKNFKDKYIDFIIKACYTEVHEWYNLFTMHSMQPIAKKALGHNISWDSEDWRAELKKLPELGWLLDDDFKYATGDMLYLFTHLEEAHKLGQLVLKFIGMGTLAHHMAMGKDVHKYTLIDKDYFESDHAQFVYKTLDLLLKNLGNFSDEEIEAYIHEDIKDESVSTIFDLLNSHYKYNPWLMHFIYEMRANSNPDLKELELLK